MPFTAQTRLSGVDLLDRVLRKGAVDAILAQFGLTRDRRPPSSIRRSIASRAPAARRWRSPTTGSLLGVIHLKDIVKPDIRPASRNCARWASGR